MHNATSTRRSTGPRPGARRSLPVVAVLALVLAGCGATDEGDPTPADPAPTTAPTATAGGDADPTGTDDPTDQDGATTTEDDMDVSPTPIPVPGPALPTGPVPDGVVKSDDVQEAIASEAVRKGVEPDEVEVVGYAEVTWPDGSLGCPQPGQMYTQALVPGRQLVLAVDGAQASYHSAREGSFSYCADPMAPAGQGAAPTDR